MNRVRHKGKLSTIIIMGVFTLMLIFFAITRYQNVTAATTYPYLLKVNKQQNVITVYKKDKAGDYTVPYKAFVCSTGVATPLGTFRTPERYRWKLLDGDVWGQYSTRITKGILFHSVWYYKPDPSTLSAKQYNKLGTAASHGCVRVAVADVKWIYDNCPIGTTVTIYNSKDPGPLGKPQAIKIKEGTGWDPTDIWSKNNPYNNQKPTIVGAMNKTVKFGTKVDLKKGISALSTTGLYITSDIKVDGKVNVNKAGSYKVTYSVTDLLGRKASKAITYKVLKDTSTPVLTGIVDQVVSKDTVIDRAFALKRIKATAGKQVLSSKYINTEITKNEDNTYTIDYFVTGPNGKTTEAVALISVDSEAPKITGVEDREIAWDTVVNKEFALEGIKVTDDYSNLENQDIIVAVIDNGDKTYNVTYEIADECGNITNENALFTITDFLKIEGVEDQVLPLGYVIDENYVKQGIKATDNGRDITWKLSVSISALVDNAYTVTYSVKDDYGHEEIVTGVYTITLDKVETPDIE